MHTDFDSSRFQVPTLSHMSFESSLTECVEKVEKLELQIEGESKHQLKQIPNAELIALLESCDNYVQIQTALTKHLSDGIVNLSKARKNGYSSIVRSVEDIRDDFDATLVLVESLQENNEDVDVNKSPQMLELIELDLHKETIFLVSGMPPPALRKAQNNFQQAVRTVVELARISQSIHQEIQSIDNLSL